VYEFILPNIKYLFRKNNLGDLVMEWIYVLLLLLVLLIVSCLIYSRRLNSKIKKGMEYEDFGIGVFHSLKRSHPDISVNGTIDENWFLSLEMNQINEIKKYISHYLQMNEEVTEEELKNQLLQLKGNLNE
jgi:hypothetical protein